MRWCIIATLAVLSGCGGKPASTTGEPSYSSSHGALTAGARCSRSQECASGFCLNTGPSKSCVSACTGDADCPSGWSCEVWQGLDAHRHYCEPPSLAWRRRLLDPSGRRPVASGRDTTPALR